MIRKLIKENSEAYEILKEVSTLENHIFKGNPYSYETLVEMLDIPENYKIFVYLGKNKQVLAYLLVVDSIDCYEILKIAVLEEFRGKNIAEDLLREILDKDIFLEVRESNLRAIKFYEKNNFKRISIRKNYYKDNNENAIIMKMEVVN